MAEATTKPAPCQVRSKTESPCPRRAEVEILGVAFCGPCAREQEAYFAIGELADEEARDPYRLWEHTHSFHEVGDETIIEDVVRYGLPFWPLGEIAHPLVRLQLGRIFRFRQSAVRRALLHRKLPVRSSPQPHV